MSCLIAVETAPDIGILAATASALVALRAPGHQHLTPCPGRREQAASQPDDPCEPPPGRVTAARGLTGSVRSPYQSLTDWTYTRKAAGGRTFRAGAPVAVHRAPGPHGRAGLRRRDRPGGRAARAAGRSRGRYGHRAGHRTVHVHLGRVRDGPGGGGHGHVLERLRRGRDPRSDPGRRLRHHDDGLPARPARLRETAAEDAAHRSGGDQESGHRRRTPGAARRGRRRR